VRGRARLPHLDAAPGAWGGTLAGGNVALELLVTHTHGHGDDFIIDPLG